MPHENNINLIFLQTYMAPWLSIFGDFTKDPEIMYNNFRVYGTGLLLLMGEYYDEDNNNLHFMEELSCCPIPPSSLRAIKK